MQLPFVAWRAATQHSPPAPDAAMRTRGISHSAAVGCAAKRDDRGMVAIWVRGVGLGIVAFVGLIVVDGGTVLRTRSQAFTIAGAAARAGAQAIDDDGALRGDVEIDPSAAQGAAGAYLDAHDMDGSVTVAGNRVTVTVNGEAELRIYPGSITVTATATAVALEGQEEP